MPKTLISAVGYLRRSTKKQEASIPEQKKAIREYAKRHGYRIVRWYGAHSPLCNWREMCIMVASVKSV